MVAVVPLFAPLLIGCRASATWALRSTTAANRAKSFNLTTRHGKELVLERWGDAAGFGLGMFVALPFQHRLCEIRDW